MSKQQAKERKTFVIDTNVLLHDPQSVTKLGSNDIVLPMDVISELDKFKSEQTERGANARAAIRIITKLSEEGDLKSGVACGESILKAAIFSTKGASLLNDEHGAAVDWEYADNRILAIAAAYNCGGRNTIVLTNDLAMQVKARMYSLKAESFRGKVVPKVPVREVAQITLDPAETESLFETGETEFPVEHPPAEGYAVGHYNTPGTKGETDCTVPVRVTHEEGRGAVLRALTGPTHINIPGGAKGIQPRSDEQAMLIDALTDKNIKFVTVTGRAGTGKTFITMACALQQVLEYKHDSQYDGVIVSRPVVEMGNSIGFLPGDMKEKLDPWMQPIYDSLEILCTTDKQHKKKKDKKAPASGVAPKPYQEYLDANVIELEALCFIRGRSIPNKFFIVDEAQQLSPLEAKTILTRMSEGSKIVFIGDPDQIDNPHVDSRSNGMVYAKNALKKYAFSAHVELTKGERSEIAEAAAISM